MRHEGVACNEGIAGFLVPYRYGIGERRSITAGCFIYEPSGNGRTGDVFRYSGRYPIPVNIGIGFMLFRETERICGRRTCFTSFQREAHTGFKTLVQGVERRSPVRSVRGYRHISTDSLSCGVTAPQALVDTRGESAFHRIFGIQARKISFRAMIAVHVTGNEDIACYHFFQRCGQHIVTSRSDG